MGGRRPIARMILPSLPMRQCNVVHLILFVALIIGYAHLKCLLVLSAKCHRSDVIGARGGFILHNCGTRACTALTTNVHRIAQVSALGAIASKIIRLSSGRPLGALIAMVAGCNTVKGALLLLLLLWWVVVVVGGCTRGAGAARITLDTGAAATAATTTWRGRRRRCALRTVCGGPPTWVQPTRVAVCECVQRIHWVLVKWCSCP